MFTFGSLFAGIGGFDLGLERAGMQCRWQVEIDGYCQRVLAKHWPNVPRFGDIRAVGKDALEEVDLICGGFPCQPFSVAGKRKGKDDNRYLWPEMLRVITEVRPAWVLGENVPGIISMELDTVLADLEGEGYETQTFVIPACGVDAPHRRDRVWIVGYSAEFRCNQLSLGEFRGTEKERWMLKSARAGQDASDAIEFDDDRAGFRTSLLFQQQQTGVQGNQRWSPESGVGRRFDGVPHRVDRLRALGNAVVPQVVEVLGRMILDVLGNDNSPASSEGPESDPAQRP